MEPNTYYRLVHRQAIKKACTNDAVLHALKTLPDKKFKALRQAISDEADLQAGTIRLEIDARQWMRKENPTRHEQETMKGLEKAHLNELLIETVSERDKYFPPHHQQAICDAIIDDAVRHTLRQTICDYADL